MKFGLSTVILTCIAGQGFAAPSHYNTPNAERDLLFLDAIMARSTSSAINMDAVNKATETIKGLMAEMNRDGVLSARQLEAGGSGDPVSGLVETVEGLLGGLLGGKGGGILDEAGGAVGDLAGAAGGAAGGLAGTAGDAAGSAAGSAGGAAGDLAGSAGGLAGDLTGAAGGLLGGAGDAAGGAASGAAGAAGDAAGAAGGAAGAAGDAAGNAAGSASGSGSGSGSNGGQNKRQVFDIPTSVLEEILEAASTLLPTGSVSVPLPTASVGADVDIGGLLDGAGKDKRQALDIPSSVLEEILEAASTLLPTGSVSVPLPTASVGADADLGGLLGGAGKDKRQLLDLPDPLLGDVLGGAAVPTPAVPGIVPSQTIPSVPGVTGLAGTNSTASGITGAIPGVARRHL